MHVAARLTLLPALLLSVVLTGCELVGPSSGEPIPADSQIEFTGSSSWGAIRYDLTVSEDGLVTNRAVTPHLTRQFTPEEHRQILDAFDGFAALPEQIGGCD
ncbi:MAG TPA: hypothetical protein VFG50_14835, partial [Rhodothermales bacterium]|nr:hypothetical protein [Rhodothermales bacterium]